MTYDIGPFYGRSIEWYQGRDAGIRWAARIELFARRSADKCADCICPMGTEHCACWDWASEPERLDAQVSHWWALMEGYKS